MTLAGRAKPAPNISQWQRIDIYDVMDFIVACCKIFICVARTPAMGCHSESG